MDRGLFRLQNGIIELLAFHSRGKFSFFSKLKNANSISESFIYSNL